MAPVYAHEGPFKLLESPLFRLRKEDPSINLTDDESLYIASEMCTVHNLIVRGLNSIYLQAPHIKPADEKDFTEYMDLWCILVNTHHHEEETYFFPWVEELTGEKGLMAGNLEQHKAFHGGLEHFMDYVADLQAGKEKYDGKKVLELIDSFGQVLTEHLGDEIPTLLGLNKYSAIFTGENSLKKKMDTMGKDAMGSVSLSKLAVMFANIDVEYEGGLWKSWPPAPGFIKLLLRYIFYALNNNETRFGACDKHGRLQPLYAVADKD
ncbi:hemerythrin HHE cation binding domain containing protein [Rhypophila sp. PSN 637]